MSSIVWWFLSSSAYIYFEFFWLFSCRDVFCRCLDLKVLMSYGSCRYVALVVFFFFQAEDGIRDDLVTGVQTCALPIFRRWTLAEIHDALGADASTVLPPLLSLRTLTIQLPEYIVRAVETMATEDATTEIGRAHV